jgi:hypothetical protein
MDISLDLAQAIYVQRIGRLGSNDWDFKPHAKKALDAARVFAETWDEAQPVKPTEQVHLQSSQQPSQAQAGGAGYPGAPEVVLPPNPPGQEQKQG